MKITDKIVTVLLSFLTLPVAVFTPLVHILYQITAWQMIEQFAGISDASDTGLTEDAFSIKWLIDKLINSDFSFGRIDTSSMSDQIKSILPFLAAAAILFALATLTGVALFAVCAASRAKKAQCIISAAGIAQLIACGILFSKFAAGIVEGTVSVGSIIQGLFPDAFSSWGSFLTSSVIDIKRLNLSTAWSVMMMLFFAVIIWNVSYMVTSNDKKADKK